MKVFADLHHHDLYRSLQILFEKRLQWKLYHPVGIEWYQQRYWGPKYRSDTAGQFLKKSDCCEQNIYLVKDWFRPDAIKRRGITLDHFKEMQFDIIIASMPQHIDPFKKLINNFQPKAKFVFQAGNNWRSIAAANLMTSAKKCYSSVKNANVVYYHQEFDLDLFKPQPCQNPYSISNLQHYSSSITKLEQVAKYLPKWDIKIYGAGGRDHPLDKRIWEVFKDSGFIWHVKKEDEGYGYNIHQSFATGTPMVVGYSYQAGFTAGDLYKPQETIIDANTNSPEKIAYFLNKMADNYAEYSLKVYNQFKQVVDFENEFQKIKNFLNNLR